MQLQGSGGTSHRNSEEEERHSSQRRLLEGRGSSIQTQPQRPRRPAATIARACALAPPPHPGSREPMASAAVSYLWASSPEGRPGARSTAAPRRTPAPPPAPLRLLREDSARYQANPPSALYFRGGAPATKDAALPAPRLLPGSDFTHLFLSPWPGVPLGAGGWDRARSLRSTPGVSTNVRAQK